MEKRIGDDDVRTVSVEQQLNLSSYFLLLLLSAPFHPSLLATTPTPQILFLSLSKAQWIDWLIQHTTNFQSKTSLWKRVEGHNVTPHSIPYRSFVLSRVFRGNVFFRTLTHYESKDKFESYFNWWYLKEVLQRVHQLHRIMMGKVVGYLEGGVSLASRFIYPLPVTF